MRAALLPYLFVAVGGALGACARFSLNQLFQRDSVAFLGTLSSNLLGCLIIGVVAQVAASTAWLNIGGVIPDQYRLLFAVGFCGAFTTLSAFVVEVNTLLQKGESMLAAGYFAVTMLGSFLAFFIGLLVTRHVLS